VAADEIPRPEAPAPTLRHLCRAALHYETPINGLFGGQVGAGSDVKEVADLVE
jgi:hypothetical protein